MQNYLSIIEELSKSTDLHEGEIQSFTSKILLKSSQVLTCARCNAWLFEEDQTKIASLLAYSASDKSFHKEAPLLKDQLPNYFKFLTKNQLIVSDNARSEPMNSELVANYLDVNQITSMIDVPLRSEGKMIGVICFEHVQKKHQWTIEEQTFTQSVAQLLSLALETAEKKTYRLKLERIIKQKEVLLSEINHRVKNNMAVIMSLLNLQKQKTKDTFHSNLFEDIKHKVFSMSMIQEQLQAKGNFDNIDLGEYLENLVENLNNSYGQDKKIEINLKMERIGIDISKAIPCGLIANEILTNSFKYAFNSDNTHPKLSISLIRINNGAELSFKDNGTGFDLNKQKIGMGLELIKDLSEQIDAILKISVDDGVKISISFPIH